MRGTLNAAPAFQLVSGPRVSIEEVDTATPGRVPTLDLVATHDGAELWRVVLPGMEPDPTTMATDTNNVDYRAFEWTPAQLLVVAGEARAYVLDVADGSIRRTLGLAMTGVSTLDFLEIGELPGTGLLAVTTPKAAWLVDRAGSAEGPYHFDGPIESVYSTGTGQVVLRVYDVGDPALPVVEYPLERTGR